MGGNVTGGYVIMDPKLVCTIWTCSHNEHRYYFDVFTGL
jgi:hypothetical protein